MKRRVILYITLIMMLVGCYPTSLSFRDGSVPPEWKRFMVNAIENKAANAPISYTSQLGELIKDGIQNQVGLTLVNNESEDPQITVTGTISAYTVTPLSLQDNNTEVKNRLTIRGHFEIFISVPKEEIMKLNVARFADFDASQDVGAIQSVLLEEINEQIVQDVINKLLSNW